MGMSLKEKGEFNQLVSEVQSDRNDIEKLAETMLLIATKLAGLKKEFDEATAVRRAGRPKGAKNKKKKKG